MMHCTSRLALYRQRFHNRQAMGWKNEASLSYTVPGLTVTVTTLLVSVIYVCAPLFVMYQLLDIVHTMYI